MFKRYIFLSTVIASLVISGLISSQALAEDKKPKLEDLVEAPAAATTDSLEALPERRRAKVTEEQAIAQLKYMMIAAFKRNEQLLLDRGSFKPMGMTLDPNGNFRAIRVDGQDEMPQNVAVEAIVKSLKGLAANRTQWAVGLIYVTANLEDDGSVSKRIVVATEHIAGWARSWVYPYAVIDGQVKMGQPRETKMKPVYYQR